MNSFHRAAFFPDTFHEVNGVAHTSRQFERFARRRQIPFLSVRPGKTSGIQRDGVVTMMDLKRSPLSFGLDAHLDFDPVLLRHAEQVVKQARRLGVELVHITGPGDMGMLGLYVAWRLNLPIVMGWHTNLHEYVEKRLDRLLGFAGKRAREGLAHLAGRASLAVLSNFYRRAQIVLAPNRELTAFVGEISKRPTYLMQRGVDVELFTPAKRDRTSPRFRIGYVGRLTAEKNVRLLAELGKALQRGARRDFEFHIIGQGNDRDWLAANVPNATLPGVLLNEELARAYANMDLFVFPSKTDTFGNVVLEAMASGLPCVVTAHGGPRHLVQPGVTGYVAQDDRDFFRCVAGLVSDLDSHSHMKDAARHYACGFSWNSVFETVFRAYEIGLSSSHVRGQRRNAGRAAESLRI